MALYIESADLMVYHVPKCGGTWVRQALNRWGVVATQVSAAGVSTQHSAPVHHPDHHGPRLVFLREPVDWYESWWRYQCAQAWPRWEPSRWHPCRHVDERRGAKTLAEWVESVTLCDAPLTTLYAHYVGSMVDPPNDQPRGMLVASTESISAILQYTLDGHGVPFGPVDVPRANVSPPCDLGDRSEYADTIRRAEHLIYDEYGNLWE